MGTTGKSKESIPFSGNSSLFEAAQKEFFRQSGRTPVSDQEADTIAKNVDNASFSELLDMSEKLGADAMVGFDNSMDGRYSIFKGKLYYGSKEITDPNVKARLLGDIEANPVSMDAIKKSIKKTVKSVKTKNSMAKLVSDSTIVNKAIENFNGYSSNTPITKASNPKMVGFRIDTGRDAYYYQIEVTKTRTDGSTYRIVEDVMIPKKLLGL